jgi:hypothetical protein
MDAGPGEIERTNGLRLIPPCSPTSLCALCANQKTAQILAEIAESAEEEGNEIYVLIRVTADPKLRVFAWKKQMAFCAIRSA